MNRSIQVEGSFATVKEDMDFRQYIYRGNTNVLAQSILAAIAHNINKLHHRIQSGQTRTHLFPLENPEKFWMVNHLARHFSDIERCLLKCAQMAKKGQDGNNHRHPAPKK